MRRDIIGRRPHVNFLINIKTRNDKEDTGTPGSSRYKSAKSEDDSSLVLLDNLHSEEEAEGESGQDQHDGEHLEQVGEQIRTLITR